MKRNELVELLASHADLLNAGEEQADAYSARYGSRDEISALFLLARRLKLALAPVSPGAAYREQLYGELAQTPGQIVVSTSPSYGRKVWFGAATVGSLLSLAGLVFWLRRHRDDASLVELSAG